LHGGVAETLTVFDKFRLLEVAPADALFSAEFRNMSWFAQFYFAIVMAKERSSFFPRIASFFLATNSSSPSRAVDFEGRQRLRSQRREHECGQRPPPPRAPRGTCSRRRGGGRRNSLEALPFFSQGYSGECAAETIQKRSGRDVGNERIIITIFILLSGRNEVFLLVDDEDDDDGLPLNVYGLPGPLLSPRPFLRCPHAGCARARRERRRRRRRRGRGRGCLINQGLMIDAALSSTRRSAT